MLGEWLTVAAYLVALNAAAAAAFAMDKRAAARGGWRIPERRLLLLAALGGAAGVLVARAVLRHKTRKAGFGAALWTIATAQGAGALAYLLLR